MRIAVVIPARDEETALPRVLEAIPRDLVERVVVVDNGSTDGTAQAARSRGADLAREPRPGYGAACLRGVARLVETGDPPGVVVFLDADYSDYPGEMPRLIGPILRDEADLVIGSRVLGRREPGALLPQARAGNWIATRLMRLLYGGGRWTDLGPFRAVRFDALLTLRMADRYFGWTAEMQVKALLAGLRVMEVPVSYRRRVGVSKISGTVKGTIRAGVKILWIIARHRLPLRKSGPPGGPPAGSGPGVGGD